MVLLSLSTYITTRLFSVPVHGMGKRGKVVHAVCTPAVFTPGCLQTNQEDNVVDVRVAKVVLKYSFTHSVLNYILF